MRLDYYRTKLKAMGENCRIGCNVKIINPQYVSLGDDVRIGDDTTIIAHGPLGVNLADHVNVKDRVYLNTESGETGFINVGEYTYIGAGTMLFGHKGLEIGHSCLLAQNITIVPYSHIHADPDDYICRQDCFDCVPSVLKKGHNFFSNLKWSHNWYHNYPFLYAPRRGSPRTTFDFL